MGQTLGRAPLLGVSRHFANLPCRCVHELWKAFNDVAEGFGLTREEMSEILRVGLKNFLGYTEKKLENLSRELFKTLDDDQNDLADALEFLSCVCIISGMSASEKMIFVFGLYDFDESGVLTVDEMILLLRSTLSGLCKLSGMDMPKESEAERVAIGAFENAKSIDGSTISVDDFVRYCTSTPEIMSWLDFYLDIAEAKRVPLDQAGDAHSADALILAERDAISPVRTQSHRIAMDDDFTGHIETLAQIKQVTQRPLPPWRHMVALAPPEKFTSKDLALSEGGRPPPQGIELEWIQGINAQRRSALAYSALGELLYPAGSLGVILDTANRKQRFITAHTDIVECLRTYNKGSETIIATGQAGHVPKIVVWACTTSEVLATIRGLHRSAILHLDFSACGTRLVTVGAAVSDCTDAARSQLVAVYAWEKAHLLFTAALDVTHAGLVLDSRFLGNGHQLDFAVCGQHQLLFFWHESTQDDEAKYRQEAGLLCNRICTQPILCVAGLEIVTSDSTNAKARSVIITGTASGHLLEWESRTCVQARKVHALAVTALATHSASSEFGLVSGSKDGRVQLWTRAMELGPCLDLKAIGAAGPSGIRGLAWDAARRKVAVVTESAELFELLLNKDGRTLRSATPEDDGPLITGHAERRVCALAAHPRQAALYLTVGDDCRVNLWNAEERRVLRSVKLDTMARCCAFSSDGTYICIGLGGVDKVTGNRQRKDGVFCVLDTETLSIIHEARDSKQPISCVAFSPDGLTLACGSEDRILYLYNANDFASIAKCRGHRGRLMQVDWSFDSKLLQSTDDVGELLYWDADSGEQRPPRFVKDTQWQTYNCVFGWHIQGAWGPESSLANSPHLNDFQLVSAARNDDLMATLDNFGKLRLWAYPANSAASVSRCYRAHAAPGGNVRFASDGSRLFSTGRGDGVVAQWRLVLTEDEDDASMTSSHMSRSKASDQQSTSSSVATVSEVSKTAYLQNVGNKLKRSDQLEASAELDKTALFLMEERGSEEDYAPTRPWQRSLVAPSRPPTECLAVPADRLELEWVHGIRSHDIRGQLNYCPGSGDIVFPAGNVVVSMNSHERSQRFLNEHGGEVVSVCVHQSQPLAASGDLCASPTVVVWDYVTLQPLRVLKGHHKRAVFLLAFSHDEDAKFLVSIGSDDAHTAVIFDWRHDCVVARTPTQKSKPLDLLYVRPGRGFGAGDCGFILCGDGFVHFWNFNGASANATTQSIRLGVGKHRKPQPFLCLAWLEENNLVIGALDGSLIRLSGRHLDKIVSRAHAGAINSAVSTEGGLATGGSDGFVRLWNPQNLEPRLEVDLRSLGALDACVQAVTWDEQRSRIAVATMSSEIWEFDASDGSNVGGGNGAVLHGHYDGELWGLSVHPILPQFATCGDDAMLRIWSLFEKRQVRSHTLEMSARACAYSPDGLRLAIGYGAAKSNAVGKQANGGSRRKQFEGKLVILDIDDFTVLHETRDSHKWITEIKYSPSGELLAVGSADTRIYVYIFDNSMLRLQHMITQHSSGITHLDFSVINAKMQYLQSNCAGHELCFFEADTGMYIPAASRLKDVKWTTNTCPYSWATQGAWPAENDGTEITACDASLKSHAPALAAADSFGRIRVFRFPASSSSAKSKEYHAHSQNVTKVRWAGADSHLLSCSAHDKCVMQWRHILDDAAAEEEDAFTRLGTEQTALTTFLEDDMGTLSGDATYATGHNEEDDEEDDGDDEGKVIGAAAKKRIDTSSGSTTSPKWLLAVVPPSEAAHKQLDPSPPKLNLRLVWSHGCQVERSSVVYNALGEAVYPSGKLCIVYSPRSHNQTFYRGHAKGGPVSAVAAAPNGIYLASGEVARRPQVHVWDARAASTAVVLKPFHRQRVAALAFSGDSRRLVSVGADADGSLAVWRSVSGEWHDGMLQAAVHSCDRLVRFACFGDVSLSSATSAENFELCSGGDGHIYFWTLWGRELVSSEALWTVQQLHHRSQSVLCGAAVNDRFITGLSDGQLLVWKGRSCEKSIKAHDGAIESIHAAPGDAGFATGSRDGVVKLWSSRFRHVKSFELTEAPVPPLEPRIRSVHLGLAPAAANGIGGQSKQKIVRILVGCVSSEVYEIAKESGSMTLFPGEGHFANELWALCAHPSDPDVFATAGDDKTVRVWSLSAKRLLRKTKLDGPLRSIAWSPDGMRLLVGMGGTKSGTRHAKDGVFVLLDAASLRVTHEARDSRYWFRAAKFSPDGTKFALGSTDHKIYLYDSHSTNLLHKSASHNAYLTNIDFSTDSKYIQSDAGDLEHLYHETCDGAQIRLPSQLKDIQWHTWSCIYGWPVQGCWPALSGDEDRDPKAKLTAVSRNPRESLLAAGDDNGEVRLYRYPSLQKQVSVKCDHGHASELASLVFTCDGKHLISIGKHDRTIAIWEIEEEEEAEARQAE